MEVTMLDCIKRTPKCMNEMIENAKGHTQALAVYLEKDLDTINEIVIIASGSSYHSGLTTMNFIESVTGLPVKVFVPNTFSKKSLLNENALYIFVSQTGTSGLVIDMVKDINDKGYHTLAITEHAHTPVSEAAACHIDVGCGYEEFGYRTVGFCCSVFALQLTGLRLGLERGHINETQFNYYLEDARKVVENQPDIVEKSLKWFDNNKETLKKANTIYYYGSGELYGIALEGALKMLETARIYRSVGYEAEDGLHGPNLGFQKDDIVISLCDGENDLNYSRNVVKFAKNELLTGYEVGPEIIDENDLKIRIASLNFRAIEFAAVVEVLAYELAIINDIPVLDMTHRLVHASQQYFTTHRG